MQLTEGYEFPRIFQSINVIFNSENYIPCILLKGLLLSCEFGLTSSHEVTSRAECTIPLDEIYLVRDGTNFD